MGANVPFVLLRTTPVPVPGAHLVDHAVSEDSHAVYQHIKLAVGVDSLLDQALGPVH